MYRVLRLLFLCLIVTGVTNLQPSMAIESPEVPQDQSGISVPAVSQPADRTSVPGGNTVDKVPRARLTANSRSIPERGGMYIPPMPIDLHVGPLKPRRVCEKDFYLNVVDRSLHHTLIVKFTEESKVRWNGGLYSKSGTDLGQVIAFQAAHPDKKIRRESKTLPEELLDYWEANGQRNTGKDLANMNNYYVIECPENPDPMSLIEEVIAIDIVETAFYLPPAQEACVDMAPDTPDFRSEQDYQDPAPLGVDADFAWAYHSGGAGHSGAWCFDIENDWTEGHEDFNAGFAVLGGGDNNASANHGDAVIGVFASCNNGADGCTGISYNVTPKGCSWSVQAGSPSEQWANAFNVADSWLFPGESYLIEIHWPGPDSGVPCGACGNCDQYEYIAVEYWQNAFDAIENHTANGIIVYEAAGNGTMNLDNAIYGDRFDRTFRDSNAIVVGAGTCVGAFTNMCWSNYGSRLDLSGWGQCVVTLGYGDRYTEGSDETEYTDTFGGTSSATPIVAGSGNCLQGIAQDKYDVTLTPAQMASYMSTTGTPWGGSRDIGERPDLEAAINRIEPDVYPAIPAGWSYSFTPRDAAGATEGNCLITTILDGNANTTHLNFAGYNAGPTPAPDGDGPDVYTELYIDNAFTFWVSHAPTIPQFSWEYWNNWGPITVRGGRHMTRWWLDPDDSFNEESETNNWIYRQFVWSPLQLTNGSGLSRSAPPLKDWGSPTYFSGEGLRATGTFWTACGVLPQSGNDIDLYSYADSYTSTSGFTTSQEASSYGSSVTDFILINGNTLGYGQTRLFQAIRYLDGSTANYAVEGDGSTTIGSPYTTTRTLSAYEVLDVFEFNPGANNDFGVVVDQVTGGLDLAIALFQPGGDYHDRAEAWITEDDYGADGEEDIYTQAPAAGWIGCVVFKQGSVGGYGESGNYRFRYTTSPQPNLIALERTGWDDPVVLRNTADATGTNAVFPAQIQGNVTNYLNRTWTNDGTGPSQSAFQVDVQIDGVLESAVLNGGVLYPYNFAHSLNTNIGTVRGGRHTVLMVIDVLNDEVESNESDNEWSQQYVWSPLALTYNTPLDRAAPPDRGTGPYPNSDGFSFTSPSLAANVVAILSPTAAADYDLYTYTNYVGTFSGFSLLQAASLYVGGLPDYVLVPWRLTSGGYTQYAAAVEFNNAANNYYVEGDHGDFRTYVGPTWTIPNPDTLLSGNILNVYEIYLSAGQSHRIVCDVTSGTADVGLRLHRDSTAVSARSQTVALANANGAGGDELLIYTPPYTDWYALVVEKTNSASAAQTAIYNLNGYSAVPAIPQHLVIQVMNSQVDPIQMRAHWDSVTTDINGNPMNVDQYQLFYTLDPNLVGFPAGWTPYIITTQATQNFGVTVSVGYFRMVVVAQDSDGLILSHSPLPDGRDITGTRLQIDPAAFPLQGSELPILGADGRQRE